MSKVLKKLKLNELQKENLSSKEMQRLAGGGDYQCGCAGACIGNTNENDYMNGLTQGKYDCGG